MKKSSLLLFTFLGNIIKESDKKRLGGIIK